jgi:aminoglycoside phosphotransferase (APT) family kinase protein
MLDQRETTRAYVLDSGDFSGDTPRPVGRIAPLVDPCDVNAVAGALLAYLKKRFASDDIHYLAYPAYNPNGWETHTFTFQLAPARSELFPGYDRPLVLRVYSSPQGVPRAAHEFAVQRYLHGHDYPVPQPFLLEETCEVFGGPFLLMEKISGQTFYDNLLYFTWMMWPRCAAMARLHARLHQLPTEGFPSPPGPFLTRRLDEMSGLIRDYDLRGLRSGWDWLTANQPPSATPRILHLDYHPFNLLCGWYPAMHVLDWSEAELGDPHADVATSLMLMRCCSAKEPNAWERLTLPLARWLVSRWYLRVYRWQIPLDRGTLAYYQAMAALKRLCGYGRWLRAGPLSTGCKPTSIRYLNRRHLKGLQDYFQKYSGVQITLLPESAGRETASGRGLATMTR